MSVCPIGHLFKKYLQLLTTAPKWSATLVHSLATPQAFFWVAPHFVRCARALWPYGPKRWCLRRRYL